MKANTSPTAAAQRSDDEPTSITKMPSDNDTGFTLPNPAGQPRSNLHYEGFPNGSVMWDGPAPLGDGARSAVPGIPHMKTVNSAKGVTDPMPAQPAAVSGAAFATADPQKSRPSDPHSVPTNAPPNSTMKRGAEENFLNDDQFVIESVIGSEKEHDKSSVEESAPHGDKERARRVLAKHPGLSKSAKLILEQALGAEEPAAPTDPELGDLNQFFERAGLEKAQETEKQGEPENEAEPAQAPERLSALNLDQAFERVKAARAAIRAAEEARTLRKDTEPGAATLQDYEKRVAYLEPLYEHALESMHSQIPWIDTFDMLNVSRSTFSKYRSAIKWKHLERLKTLVADQDRVQRSEGHTHAWALLVEQLRDTLHAYREICELSYDEYRGQESWPPSRLRHEHPPRSKKHAVKKLPDGWQERFLFLNERSPIYRYVGVLLRFCGLRPAELEQGVGVRWTARGIRVFIRGAKVRATAGQPWRSFLLESEQLPDWFVQEVREKRYLRVSCNGDNLRAHLARMSEAVLNPTGRKNGCQENLSAYLFRHALATELREAGWATDAIAAVIGEGSAETVRLYGIRVRGDRAHRPATIVRESTMTARAVRAVDMQFIQLNLAAHAKRAL